MRSENPPQAAPAPSNSNNSNSSNSNNSGDPESACPAASPSSPTPTAQLHHALPPAAAALLGEAAAAQGGLPDRCSMLEVVNVLVRRNCRENCRHNLHNTSSLASPLLVQFCPPFCHRRLVHPSLAAAVKQWSLDAKAIKVIIMKRKSCFVLPSPPPFFFSSSLDSEVYIHP